MDATIYALERAAAEVRIRANRRVLADGSIIDGGHGRGGAAPVTAPIISTGYAEEPLGLPVMTFNDGSTKAADPNAPLVAPTMDFDKPKATKPGGHGRWSDVGPTINEDEEPLVAPVMDFGKAGR